jgi:2'-5' RNA ligase
MINEVKKRYIITVLLEPEAQAFFTQQRNTFFPAYANVTPAHLTLFHSLPTTETILSAIQNVCKEQKSFALQINGLMHQNIFIAYQITSPTLLQIHYNLQNLFKLLLAQKDLKPLKPHITIQNKTTKAQKNLEIIQANFTPFNCKAMGLSIWYYYKKTWLKKEDILFNG